MSLSSHEQHTLGILDKVEAGERVSQRSLAKDLGIALGLTNLLIKRVVRKGWVRVIQIEPNRVRYLITPAGIAEKTRMSRAYLESSVKFYRLTRDRIHDRFLELSSTWNGGRAESGEKRIVFYGAGEVAEIGYVCLVETDFRLVGVVDEARTKAFFGQRVYTPRDLDGLALDGLSFDRLVVMSFGNTDAVARQFADRRIPPDAVFWL